MGSAASRTGVRSDVKVELYAAMDSSVTSSGGKGAGDALHSAYVLAATPRRHSMTETPAYTVKLSFAQHENACQNGSALWWDGQ